MKRPPAAESVGFTVITPTHGRHSSLRLMLEALSRQDYPFDRFEVVVVIDGLDEALLESLQGSRFPFRLRAVMQLHSGPAAARNRGLAEATEPYVLFLDDDVLPAPGLLRRHAESHLERDVVVIGPLLAASRGGRSPWTVWEWSTLEEQYRAMQSGEWAPTPRQFYTGNASVSLARIRETGGFNTAFTRGEDVELAWRLQDRGLRFVFNPRARAVHLAQRSFGAWLRSAHQYGQTDVMLERIRTGHDLPGYVQREFQQRHPYTRQAVRAVLAHPAAWGLLVGGIYSGLHVTKALGRRRAAHSLCSALFACGYWRGVCAQLGRDRAIALTREPVQIASRAAA